MLLELWYKNIYKHTDGEFRIPCTPTNVPNCVEFVDAQTCAKCRPGFYLTQDNKCRDVPEKRIDKCIDYHSATVCAKCENKYFLSNEYRCIPVEEILSCQEYDPSAFSTICTKCADGMFVWQNVCAARTILTVENCDELNPNLDGCIRCKAGFLITTDFLKCLPIIENCAQYEVASVSNTQFTCIACNIGFALENNVCLKGEVANCLVFSKANDCSKCMPEFYLAQNECKPHKKIDLCGIYHPDVADTCSSCVNSAFLFDLAKGCTPIQSITNCISYSDFQTCSACEDGYLLKENLCQLIPFAENCRRKDLATGNCILCNSGYYISTGVCKKHLLFQTVNCRQIQRDGESPDFVCNSCANYHRIFNYAGEPVCVQPSEIAVTPISRCAIHTYNPDTTPPTLICTRCAPGKFLAADYLSCLDACPTNIPIILETQTNWAVIGPRCDATESLLVAEQYVINGVTYINKCHSSAITYHTALPQPLRFEFREGILVKTFTYGTYLDQVSCEPAPVSPNTVTYFPGGATKDPNCDFWVKSSTKFYCRRCKLGKTGAVSAESNLANAETYMNCDQEVKGCDPSVVFGGLENNSFGTTKLSQIFSCHKCYRADRIPVAFVADTGKNIPFDINADQPSTGPTLTSSQTQCLSPISEDLKVKPNLFLATVPENCALLIVQSDLQKNFVNLVAATTSLQCVECKPGFRAVRDGTRVKSCVEIMDCDVMNPAQVFSKCSRCRLSYTWPIEQVNSQLVINTERCVPKNDVDCLLARDRTCLICRPGYSLNHDLVCEKITPPLCKEGSYARLGTDLTTVISTFVEEVAVRQMALPFEFGCRDCATPQIPVLWNTQNRGFRACTDSPYTRGGNFVVNTNYVRNCRNYGETCSQCEPGFVPSDDSRACVPETAFPNCQVFQVSSKTCVTCKPLYVLINGFCEKPIIPNCIGYESNTSYQICNKCDVGTRLVQNHCVPGTVADCAVFDNLGRCVACVPNFALLSVRETQYCIRLRDDFNCTAVHETQLNSERKISCTQCKPGFGFDTVTDLRPTCLNLSPVEGCIEYDTKSTLPLSTFACVNCNTTYFLETPWKCTLRRANSTNCLRDSPTNDFCSECKPQFYLSNDKTCRPYPIGDFGCINYLSDTECLQCDKGRYLQNGDCFAVDENDLIPFCMFYADSKTCQKCEVNYFLKDNTCIPSVAQNCQNFTDIATCATCPPGFGLKQNEGLNAVDCVPFNNPYCLKPSPDFPFPCLECQNFYFQDNGRCFAITTFIDNCEAYNGPNTCSRCKPDFVLNADNTLCIRVETVGLSPNPCANIRQLRAPGCSVCSLGYFFNATTDRCEICNEGRSNGCAICSVTNSTVCEICKSGYYYQKGDCISWYVPPTKDNSTTPIDTKSVRIASLIAVIAMLFAL